VNSKYGDPVLATCQKNSFLHFKCYNLAIYEVKNFQKNSTYSFSNLKQDPKFNPSKKIKRIKFLFALEMVFLECFLQNKLKKL
jgi:hypothetical protein